MEKISQKVEKYLMNDEDAKTALQNGVLSITKYAKKIQPLIAKELLKPVQLKSIVVTLHRLEKRFLKQNHETVTVKLLSITIHPNLAELTYERTSANSAQVNKMVSETGATFFAQTSSINELTIIFDNSLLRQIFTYFNKIQPLYAEENLAGITVKFSNEYLQQPMLIYELVKRLSLNGVNITEVVSTATELTFVVSRELTEQTVALLSKFL